MGLLSQAVSLRAVVMSAVPLPRVFEEPAKVDKARRHESSKQRVVHAVGPGFRFQGPFSLDSELHRCQAAMVEQRLLGSMKRHDWAQGCDDSLHRPAQE